MLEKYQSLIEKLKKCEEKQHMSAEFIQNVFEMQDVNKWLKFNAITDAQLKRVEEVENSIQALLKKICVPNYQLENA